MDMPDTAVIEVRLVDESDLRALAAGALDAPTTEAVEAYLLHHPEAAARVETYRRAAGRASKAPRYPAPCERD